jgi:hypothetical protein
MGKEEDLKKVSISLYDKTSPYLLIQHPSLLAVNYTYNSVFIKVSIFFKYFDYLISYR